MKKILATLMLVSFLAMPVIGMADDPTEVPNYDVLLSIKSIVNWVYTIFMIIAVMYFVFGAFKYLTAEGDTEKVKDAWRNIMYALIGVAVALLSRGLLTFVESMLVSS